MTRDEVEHIVSGGESELVEFKKTTGQRSKAAKTICAMLNGRGGFVVFGVSPDGKLLGQDVSDSTLRDIAEEIGRIEPQIVLQPVVVPVSNDRSVIIISMPGERDDVYQYDGRAYVRQGSTTTRMSQDLYRKHLLRGVERAGRWEARPAHDFGIDDLDHDEIIRTVEEAIRRGRMGDPGTRDISELLLGLRLLKDGKVVNAAVILFGQSGKLMPSYPQCLLRMARFRGVTKDEFIDNRQERGHAFDLFVRAQRFMRDHLPIAGRIVPHLFERKDDPLYPPEALREALANALCHRNYTMSGSSVSVAIYDDRLEIGSTGTLPEGITVGDLLEPHASIPRNDLIADVFYRRGIIDQWGRGTLKMMELAEKAGLAVPEFEERGGELIVRFRPTRYVAPSRAVHDLTPLQQDLLTALGNQGPMGLSDIMDAVEPETTGRTVRRNLNTLRELGLVKLEGHGRGAQWSLSDR